MNSPGPGWRRAALVAEVCLAATLCATTGVALAGLFADDPRLRAATLPLAGAFLASLALCFLVVRRAPAPRAAPPASPAERTPEDQP